MNKKNYAVIGDPIAHSLSPVIHNTLYGIYGLPHEYIPIQISIEQIPFFFNTMLGKTISGCNVTMPGKRAVIPHLDWVEPDALLCGSVNTISAEGNLRGWSTDASGLRAALSQADVVYEGKTLLLYGAGSAAAAIALDFARHGGKALFVYNRSRDKADALGGFLAAHTTLPALSVSEKDFPEALRQCDLFLNTTPLGMRHTGLEFGSLDFMQQLPRDCFVCDLIYNPLETRLLAAAKARGLPHMNGLPMLICQAFLSFEKWFGILPSQADYHRIYAKLLSELQGRE